MACGPYRHGPTASHTASASIALPHVTHTHTDLPFALTVYNHVIFCSSFCYLIVFAFPSRSPREHSRSLRLCVMCQHAAPHFEAFRNSYNLTFGFGFAGMPMWPQQSLQL